MQLNTQSIESCGAAMKPSNDIVKCQRTLSIGAPLRYSQTFCK
jgi:hypothetical protein